MNGSGTIPADAWVARRAPAGPDAAPPGPAAVDGDWRALRQAWRPEPEPAFQPGWARVRWSPRALHVDAVFAGRRPANRARRLNDRTWELGDICEFFVRAEGAPRYLELHVTPENRRLQLRWPEGGLADFRAGRAALADFTVADPAWVESEACVAADHWRVRLTVPFACLGLPPSGAPPRLRACVCRYDCESGAEVLSSTAPLREPDYHRVAEWQPLRLEPGE